MYLAAVIPLVDEFSLQEIAPIMLIDLGPLDAPFLTELLEAAHGEFERIEALLVTSPTVR